MLFCAGRVARRKEVPRKSSLDAAFVIGLVVLLISTTKIVVQLVAGPIGPVPGKCRRACPAESWVLLVPDPTVSLQAFIESWHLWLLARLYMTIAWAPATT